MSMTSQDLDKNTTVPGCTCFFLHPGDTDTAGFAAEISFTTLDTNASCSALVHTMGRNAEQVSSKKAETKWRSVPTPE